MHVYVNEKKRKIKNMLKLLRRYDNNNNNNNKRVQRYRLSKESKWLLANDLFAAVPELPLHKMLIIFRWQHAANSNRIQ